jgi:hypothetical protein
MTMTHAAPVEPAAVSNPVWQTKPDFPEARERWNHFWAGDVLKRPPVIAQVPKGGLSTGGVQQPHFQYFNAIHGHWEKQLEAVDRWVETTDFVAEAIPYFAPDFGPDQFAAFFGATLSCVEGSEGTSWVEPIVDDWEKALPLERDPKNLYWQRILDYSRMLRERGRGRYVVGACDLHSNADTMLALRGPERLCLDFYECPELIEQAMRQVRAAYQPIYEGLYQAGGMSRDTGSIGWIPFWSEGRYATIQCDFICMVSPAISRRYIIPALEEEAGYLDHCIYHLDGPGALPHLDDILAIVDIDAVQWVPGAGKPPMHTWLDVLLRCQAAGKGLQIYGVGIEEAKALHQELSPVGVVYCVDAQSRGEVEQFCRWLENNT